jgi:hypothetical protein
MVGGGAHNVKTCVHAGRGRDSAWRRRPSGRRRELENGSAIPRTPAALRAIARSSSRPTPLSSQVWSRTSEAWCRSRLPAGRARHVASFSPTAFPGTAACVKLWDDAVTDEKRTRLTSRMGELVLEGERLLEQHEKRFSEENERGRTILAALRRMQADPTMHIASLKKLSDEMKQRFATNMTEFTARTQRMTAPSDEATSIIARLCELSE